MTYPISIAVISDLHIGYGARAKDLCPYDDSDAPETNYKTRFLQFIKTKKIKADYLIIPGDISDKAQPDEFQLASNLIIEIAKALGVQRKAIILVPGNHDVDWNVLELSDNTGFRQTQRYAALKNREWIFNRIINTRKQSLLAPPHYFVWETKNKPVAQLRTDKAKFEHKEYQQ